MKLRLLRTALAFSAVVWGTSVFGVVASWPDTATALQGLGAGEISHDPMLEYWLRMTAGLFTCVGVLFLVLALRPREHKTIIPWFGGLMLAEGAVLLVHGLRLRLPTLPFAADSLACLGLGTAIVFLSRRAFPDTSATPQHP